MIQQIRSLSRGVLVVLTFVIILTFLFWSNVGPEALTKDNTALEIGGERISQVELDNAVVEARAWRGLQMGRPLPNTQENNQQMFQQALQNLLLEAEARDLGIRISEQEVVDAIKDDLSFADEMGKFSTDKFAVFVEKRLPRLGLNQERYSGMVANHLARMRVTAMLSAGAGVAPAEVKEAESRLYGRTHMNVVEFPYDAFTNAISVTDTEMEEEFNANRERWKTEEQRKIQYAVIRPADVEQPAPEATPEQMQTFSEEMDKARLAAEKKATDLSQQLLAADLAGGSNRFEALAGAMDVEVKETEFFTFSEPPEPLVGKSQVLGTVFGPISRERPSEIVDAGGEYWIVRLLDVVPAEPMTLEQAKPKLRAGLEQQRTMEAAQNAARAAHAVLVAGLQGGTNFAVLSSNLNLTVRELEPFVASDILRSPAFSEDAQIRQVSTRLNVGEIMPPQPGQQAMLLIHLAKRGEPEVAAEERTDLRRQMLDDRRRQVVEYWTRLALEEGADTSVAAAPQPGQQEVPGQGPAPQAPQPQ